MTIKVIPKPVYIEEYEAVQFTVEAAESLKHRLNAALLRPEADNPRTWRLTVIVRKPIFHLEQVHVGQWIVIDADGVRGVYLPEEYHRRFQVVSPPGNPCDAPANPPATPS